MSYDLDPGLLAVIRGTLNENDEGSAYVASRHHGEAFNKMLQVHKLLDQINDHCVSSLGKGCGDEHAGHITRTLEHLQNVRAHLNNAHVPLSGANVISASKTGI